MILVVSHLGTNRLRFFGCVGDPGKVGGSVFGPASVVSVVWWEAHVVSVVSGEAHVGAAGSEPGTLNTSGLMSVCVPACHACVCV